ncbi:hypothetical protein PR202_ga22014 [Eleusine coracana subsp. coracana]|uniref:Uncharacterized protein n=1 Tax=Eleusine coracana subsp. coracana TaxID=191504 RepID=A0AAV5D1G7_ELECO|nr:hypothetical protein PR202_ga22014 [Eleusine coracana subsp. coracana]
MMACHRGSGPARAEGVSHKLSEKAMECDDFLGGVSLCQDSDQNDVISFDRSDIFKCLFYAPSSGVRAKPFQEDVNETDVSCIVALQFAEALPATNDLWHNFLRSSVMDYRAIIATLARSFLWKELKKCMTEDQKAAPKFISAADIDAVFSKEDDKDDTNGAQNEVCAAESSETMMNDTELSGSPINEAESGNDLDTELKNLKIDPTSDGSTATSEAISSDP